MSRLWERLALGLLAIGMALVAYMWTNAQADADRVKETAAILNVRVSITESEINGCKIRLDKIDAKLDRILERLPK